MLERGFTAATQFYAFPEPHWARLRTTNSLERLHTEIKRRIRSADAFPDRASALRLITAVALRTTAVWNERRYLDLSLLEPQGGRQGSLTEASRSFLSLLHTTRDLTLHRAGELSAVWVPGPEQEVLRDLNPGTRRHDIDRSRMHTDFSSPSISVERRELGSNGV